MFFQVVTDFDADFVFKSANINTTIYKSHQVKIHPVIKGFI